MITGKELKRMIGAIPDGATVTVNGNWMVDIREVVVESTPAGPMADLKLTREFIITKDSVLAEMFNRFQHPMSSTPDAETR